jgi:YgiT-type zinc finger domain-containing protein
MSLPERVVSLTSTASDGRHRSASRQSRPVDLDATIPLAPEHPSEAREVLPMKCLYCQAPVERSTTQVQVDSGGHQLAWQFLPAWVCTHCQQAYFEPREVEMVRQAVGFVRRAGGATPV